MIIATKTGRNELCPCKSGKKYKHCCLEIDERREKPKGLNQAGLLAVFRKIIKDSGSYEITFNELEQIPPDEGINIHYEPENDSFVLSVVKIKRQKILVPNKRIIA
jgi:hypothetical protein